MRLAGLLVVTCLAGSSVWAESIERSIEDVRSVGREGEGNVEAGRAWNTLSKAPVEALPALFGAFEGAGPLPANYLGSAIEVVVAERGEGAPFPLETLGNVLLDPKRDSRARRLAFRLIEEHDPDFVRLIQPGLLNDPSVHLRRGAVADLIREADALAESGLDEAARLIYRQALNSARDVDQVQEIADKVRELGGEVDLPRHFGFIMHWQVVGPFDNTGRDGFAKEFPPEKGVDLAAAYPGKSGEVAWQPLVTTDELGKVDFNEPYGPQKEVVAYAFAEFVADRTQQAEIRLGTKNAWKVWLNGEYLFGRDEYHRGQRIDQYVLPVTLREGGNEILVKCCQNEQEQDWTVQWEFQLRVCDGSGTAVLSMDRPPTPEPKKASRRPNAS